MKFILIHGAFGHPEENWFPDLKDELENMGQEVIIPQFPVEDWDEVTKNGPTIPTTRQNLQNWLDVFESEVLPKIQPADKVVMIGHSLGPVFILHAVEKFNLKLDAAIFVSPFMDELKLKEKWQFDFVNKTFYKTDFDFNKLKSQLGDTYVLYSNTDPYVSTPHTELFASTLSSSTILVKKAGHLSVGSANLNEFPLVVNLCASRIDLPLLDKYIAHRGMTKATDLAKKGKIQSLVISPDEVVDEGVFHFHNLQKSGFATLLTGLDVWVFAEKYFEDARRAAKRIKDFKRVIVVEKLEDLNKKSLLDLIRKDIEAGIEMYICMADEIRGKVNYLDFGIWDEDYVCIVKYNEDSLKANSVELNSKDEEMKSAIKSKETILMLATRLTNSDEDIEKFKKLHS